MWVQAGRPPPAGQGAFPSNSTEQREALPDARPADCAGGEQPFATLGRTSGQEQPPLFPAPHWVTEPSRRKVAWLTPTSVKVGLAHSAVLRRGKAPGERHPLAVRSTVLGTPCWAGHPRPQSRTPQSRGAAPEEEGWGLADSTPFLSIWAWSLDPPPPERLASEG